MRKLVSIAVSAALMLSLAACGKADSSAAASSESKSSASSSSASSNSTSNSTQDYSPDGIKVGETLIPSNFTSMSMMKQNGMCRIVMTLSMMTL